MLVAVWVVWMWWWIACIGGVRIGGQILASNNGNTCSGPAPYENQWSVWGTEDTRSMTFYPDSRNSAFNFVNAYCAQNSVCLYTNMVKKIIRANNQGDQAAICGCDSDSNCPFSQKCLYSSCWARDSSNCPPGYVVGSFLSFTTTAANGSTLASGNFLSSNGVLYGKCVAAANRGRESCQFRGTVASAGGIFQQIKGEPGVWQSSWSDCNCVDGFGGRGCGVDTLSATRCSGQGVALCSVNQITGLRNGFREAYSLNDQTLIGSVCDYQLNANPDRSAIGNNCMCFNNYSPDRPVYNLATGALIKAGCSDPPICGTNPSIGGKTLIRLGNGSFVESCACRLDFVSDVAGLRCLSGCAASMCSSHGRCASSTASGLNDHCVCLSNWADFPQTSPNLLFSPGQQVHCNAPVINGVICGAFGVLPGTQTCACLNNAQYQSERDRGDLCIQIAQSSPALSRPSQPIMLCGGPEQGIPISDNAGGQICRCRYSWQGLACDQSPCPVVKRVISPTQTISSVCASNGLCDSITGSCVCSSGFIGVDCSIRDSGCGTGVPKMRTVF